MAEASERLWTEEWNGEDDGEGEGESLGERRCAQFFNAATRNAGEKECEYCGDWQISSK